MIFVRLHHIQDVVDLLEKRVKSRFSQNIIYLPHPRTFEAYLGAIKETLASRGTALFSKKTEQKRFRQQIETILQESRIASYLTNLYEYSHDPMPALSIFVSSLSVIML